MQNNSTHRVGIWMMVISAVVFSTAGLFTKSVNAGSWDVIFWRGIFASLVAVVFLAMRGKAINEWRTMGRAGWAIAVIGGIATAMFIASFKMTSVANVALIYAASPVLTAALAWMAMRERMEWPVVVGAIVAFAGVAVIMAGSFGGGNLWGDLLAIGMTIGMGTVMVIFRRFPKTPATMPMIISSVLLFPLCLLFGDPFSVPVDEIAIMAAFGIIFALAAVLLGEASKRVPSGEAALLSSLEAPLAPLWAWVVLSEMPPIATFIGGALILVAVIGPQIIRTKPA